MFSYLMLFFFFFLTCKTASCFPSLFCFFAIHQTPRFIHQMPCLGFFVTAVVPEILTSVVIGGNGHSSLKRCV